MAGKKIVEIGCGSGFLTPDLISGGAESYIGYDIAASALVRAKDIADEAGILGEVEYVHSSLENINHIDADIVFSLGLLDWLNDGNSKSFSRSPDKHSGFTLLLKSDFQLTMVAQAICPTFRIQK